jgi:hypothetical protein
MNLSHLTLTKANSFSVTLRCAAVSAPRSARSGFEFNLSRSVIGKLVEAGAQFIRERHVLPRRQVALAVRDGEDAVAEGLQLARPKRLDLGGLDKLAPQLRRPRFR